MSNPYYTATANPGTSTRLASSLIRAEYALIQAAFDAVYVAKGNVSGQVWTGAHDFTGATVTAGYITTLTAPITDNSTKAATTAFAAQLAFQAALPAQTSDGVLRLLQSLNGTAGYTQFLSIASTAGGTISASSLLVGVMANVAYTLPNLSTASLAALFAPSNAGAVPTTVTTSDGWSVPTAFVAGTFSMLTPTSTATAHGVWGSTTVTPPLLSTVTGAAANTVVGTALLSSTLMVVLFRDASNYYAVAVNPVTGASGAAVTLGTFNNTSSNSSGASIFADTATSFVAIFGHATTAFTVIAGSVATVTITLGTGVVTTPGTNPSLACTPIQMTSGLYALGISSLAADLIVASVSGTTVTMGTAVASGTATVLDTRILPSSASTFLVMYLAAGGGTASTRQMSTRVASVSGTTITLQTASGAGTNVCKGAVGINSAGAFVAGSSYFVVATDGSTSTTGNWYGITVSGNTATIGAISAQTNNLPALFYAPTFAYGGLAKQIKYNATTYLFGNRSAGPLAVTISGTTLTIGAATGVPAAATNFTTDASTGAIFYAVSASVYDKITVAGTTITSAYEVAVSPTFVASDTLTDKAASYSGTWYSWTLIGTMRTPISATNWLATSGNNLQIYGPIT